MWVFMFEIKEESESSFVDFDNYDFVADDLNFLADGLDDCFSEDEEYVFDKEHDCYCWYDAEHDAWYWLNEETKEWLLVEA